MIFHNLDAYLIQETWQTGDWQKTIRGYLVIHHNHDKKKWGKKRGREKQGFAVILSPNFRKAHERAGNPEPITTNSKSKFSGRLIDISLKFPNFDPSGKKIKGDLRYFIASVYHPYETKFVLRFQEQTAETNRQSTKIGRKNTWTWYQYSIN